MIPDSEAPLLERLARAQSKMRRSEAKVLDLVISDPRFVVDSTMAGVAAAAVVSEPTVMRFATGLGFDGFQQFRIALAEALALGLPAGFSSIRGDDDTATIATKVFDHTISSLDRARRYLDLPALESAVVLLAAADAIVFVGHGASGIIAEDAAQKAVLFGVPTSAPADLHQQYMAAAMAAPATVFVAISNTGATRSILEVAQRARQRGSKVIALTGDEESPLARGCDILLPVKTFENTDLYTPTVSRLAGLVIIDVLATAVSVHRGERHAADLVQMKADLARFRRE